MAARVMEQREMHPGIEGYLEDRGTQEIRKATIIAKGTAGYCIEIFKPGAVWAHMVLRHGTHYNKLTKSGWRFWNGEPEKGNVHLWDAVKENDAT